MSGEKILTGRMVFLGFLAFFGVVFAVNAVFITAAVKSFRGEDVPRSYRQGIEYNKTLSNRELQAGAGWETAYNYMTRSDGTREIIMRVTDAAGVPVNGLRFEAFLRHPTETRRDLPLSFNGRGTGHYAAAFKAGSGQWRLVADSRQRDFTFKVRGDVWLE